MKRGRIVAAALGVLIPCLAFWLWFGVASAASERLGPVNWALHLLVPGGLLLASLLVALRWKLAGGTLLLVEGLSVVVAYPLLVGGRFPVTTIALVLLTMGLPPVASGTLFLLAGRLSRPSR
jgi:hypothetical protein